MTGGQYSAIRFLTAAVLLAGLWRSADRGDLTGVVLFATLVVALVMLAVGWFDRTAAVGIIVLGAMATPAAGSAAGTLGVALVGWALAAHVATPGAPFGSLAARGRPDPGGGWKIPPWTVALCWWGLILGHVTVGILRVLRSGSVSASGSILGILQVALAAVAWFTRARPWVWLMLLVVNLATLTVSESGLAVIGLVTLHLRTFEPRWCPAIVATRADRLFYDGHCGLCHRLVRFVLAEDSRGAAFRLSPLQGDTVRREIPEPERADLPDSVVVSTDDGRVLVRSAATIRVGRRLGGLWRLSAEVARLVPVGVRDDLYDRIARVRNRWFGSRKEVCPILSEELRRRFDD